MRVLRWIHPAREKRQRHGVQAVTLVCRGRPVVENMAQMPIAAAAPDLDTDHAVALVAYFGDVGGMQRVKETRPSCARLEFGA